MTPLSYALPIILIACAGIIARRFTWRKHPALLAYLHCAAIRQAIRCWIPIPAPFVALDAAARTAALLEVCRYARVPVPRWAAPAACGAAIGLSAAAHGLTWTEHVYLWWSYYHIALAGGFGAVALYRWRHPILECRRHAVVRVGLACWIGIIALAGACVRGGLLYRLLPHYVGLLAGSTAALAVIVPIMTWRMLRAAPRRKVAAKAKQARAAWRPVEVRRAA